MVSDQRILASRRAILSSRGVPAQFLDGIAARPVSSGTFGAILILAWMVLSIVAIARFFSYALKPLDYLYSGHGTDSPGLFIPGGFHLAVMMMYVLIIPLLPFLLYFGYLARPSRDRTIDKSTLDKLAFLLREPGLKEDVYKIKPDPELAQFADSPDATAYLKALAQSRATNSAKTYAGVRLFLILVVAVFVGLCWISSQTYDLVDNNVIDHHFFTQHTSAPLSQVTSVQVDCVLHSGKRSDYYRAAYVVSFNGGRVDLFKAWNPTNVDGTLTKIADIDAYLDRLHRPITRVIPGDAALCLRDWHGNRAQLGQVLTGEPAP